MNKRLKISVLTIGASLMVAPITMASHHGKQSASGFETVINPAIPSKMEFAGQKIDLDRVDMWERLDRELTSQIYTHGNTLLTIKRANRYFPIMAPILKKYGVPEDMLYLACIESTLNPRAYSGARAAGLWQFIGETGKQYGLEVNEYVDERYDPEKATEAACKYLLKAYQLYGNWESAAASYNGGMGRISSELDKQLAKSAYDLYLVEETSRYMFRLLAMKVIMENPRNFGFQLDANQLYQPIDYDIVEVSEPVEDWPVWASQYGISYMQLRDANPWIRSKILPNKNNKVYRVRIPKKDSLLRSKQHITVYNRHWVR